MKSGTFPKRLGAATKGFESFRWHFSILIQLCIFWDSMNNLKISLALYIRLEFSRYLLILKPYCNAFRWNLNKLEQQQIEVDTSRQFSNSKTNTIGNKS